MKAKKAMKLSLGSSLIVSFISLPLLSLLMTEAKQIIGLAIVTMLVVFTLTSHCFVFIGRSNATEG